MKHIVLGVIAAGLLAGCQVDQPMDATRPQLFEGLGSHHRAVTNASPEGQKYFDQGLTFTFAFNHDEAIRSYTEAARIDPECAMHMWGVALCNGPHINNAEMDEAHSKAAWEALQKAKKLADKASPVEKALIGALSARYVDPAAGKLPLTAEERAPIDKAYAEAMRRVHGEFSKDADVGTLYAESLMDLRPWNLWSLQGEPRPETGEIVLTLESVLAMAPEHPGANHLYIHAVEASPKPEKAVPSAERLGKLAPAAGHLVHMPAHIYARVGRWDDAAKSNRAAMEADAAYRKLSPRQGFYHIYMAHNAGFLAWGCMMQGRSEEAVKSTQDMAAAVPKEFIENMAPVIDGYLPIGLEVLMRFGKWEEILKYPKPGENLPIFTAMWHFTRGVAYANTKRIAEAEKEQAEFLKCAAAIPAGRKVGNTPSPTIMTIATHVLAGEIAFKRGSTDDAIKHLKQAVEAEDTVHYDEPPDWMQPVRHTLGAVLLSAGHAAEAEKVYREDLRHWPENGWALYGLAQAMKKQKSDQYTAIEARFKKAWEKADMKIGSSCLCVEGE